MTETFQRPDTKELMLVMVCNVVLRVALRCDAMPTSGWGFICSPTDTHAWLFWLDIMLLLDLRFLSRNCAPVAICTRGCRTLNTKSPSL